MAVALVASALSVARTRITTPVDGPYMAEARHEKLNDYIEYRAGSTYRVGVYYDEDAWEFIHVRDDLRTDRLREYLSALHERLLEERALLREEDYPTLGEARATTEIHDNGVVVHFPEGEDQGTAISLDRDAARQLTGFIIECTGILQGERSGRPASD